MLCETAVTQKAQVLQRNISYSTNFVEKCIPRGQFVTEKTLPNGLVGSSY